MPIYNPPQIAVGGITVTTVEVNLGTKPRSNGKFTITGTGFTVGKPVIISQAPGPYTGKGTGTDDIEWDQIMVTGYVVNTTTIQCNWGSNIHNRVYGNVKFNYFLGV